MEVETPLLAFIKALARHQAKLDLSPPKAANSNQSESKQARKQ